MNDVIRKLAYEASRDPNCRGVDREAALLGYLRRAAESAAPPAEPDSGVQEEKPERLFGEHIRETIDAFRPLFRKPDAPSDHVEPQGQNYRQGVVDLANAVAKTLKERSAGEYDTWGFVAMFLDIVKEAQNELLSSPATSVPASPDSTPWTVIESDELCYIREGNGAIPVALPLKYLNHLHAIVGIHNATLPAPRSGSEVSGATNPSCPHPQCFNGWLCGNDPQDDSPCPLCNPPAPSAPSSTEQKGK